MALCGKTVNTRNDTNIWLVGQPLKVLTGGKLPSSGEVLRRLFYLKRVDKKILHDAASEVDDEVISFWNRARLPITQPQHRIRKIKGLFEEWRNLGKRKERMSQTEENRRNDFKNSLKNLFDIAHADSMNILKNEEDKAFLLAQRMAGRQGVMLGVDEKLSKIENNRMRREEQAVKRKEDNVQRRESQFAVVSFDFVDNSDSENADSSPERDVHHETISKKQCKSKNSISKDLAFALDRTKTTDRNAVHILAAAASSFGHNPSTLPISRQSIRRMRQKARTEKFTSLKTCFQPTVPLTVHWDGKLVCDEQSIEKHERLPILVSGFGVEKLLSVPKLNSGTGATISEQVFTTLTDWNIADHVTSMTFDTTASNTGIRSGACTLLQNMMSRELLHLACRKHVAEIVIDKAFNACTKIVSNGPDIPIFKRFKQKWASIDAKEYSPLDNLPLRVNELIDFCEHQLDNKQPRDDYQELLELTLLIVREEPPRGVRIQRPGACHRARWMAKIIYSMKIYLFRNQFHLTKSEKDGIEKFVTFIVSLYIPYWFTTSSAASAPKNDLKFLKDLLLYNDRAISQAAANSFRNHLWYLSEELVGLSFFDDSIDITTKRKMVESLQREGSTRPNKRLNLDLHESDLLSKTIPDFVTSTTRRFFSLIGSSSGFLDADPSIWSDCEDYTTCRDRVHSLKVTNDFAERGVALMQDYLPILTKDEYQRQYLFHVIESHQKRFPDSRKSTVVQNA